MDTKSKAERALKILLDCNQRGIAGVADFLDIQEILQAYLTQCAEVERLKGLMLEQTKLNARVIKERVGEDDV